MKTILLSLLAASLAAVNLPAQVYITGAQPAPEPEPVPAVVYQAPVVYQVPVVYQAPVVYQSSVAYEARILVEAAPVYCPQSPNVIYFGGPQSACRNAYQCNPYSPVIYFGRGESYQRGYHFSHPR